MVQTAPHLERLNHPTRRRMDLSQGNYDGLDEARTYYYSANWQMLEEHVDTDLDRRMQECSGQSGDLEPPRSGVHILGPAPFQAACRRS